MGEIIRKRFSNNFNSVVEALQEGYFLIDEGLGFRDANTIFSRMVGYSTEELLTASLSKVDPEMTTGHHQELFDEMEQEGNRKFEACYQTKDRGSINIQGQLTLLEQDGVKYLAGFVQELTEKEDLAQKLSESEERWKRLVVNNPECVLVMRFGSGSILFVNQAGADLFGYSKPEEIIGESILDFIHPDDKPVVKKRMKKVRGQKELDPLEEKIVKPDGSIAHILVYPVRVSYLGEPAIQTLAHDITELKQREKELRENQQRFRSLFEHNPNAVFSFDTKGNFIKANEELEKMLGYTETELKEMNFEQVLLPKNLKQVWKHFKRAVHGEPHTYETKSIHKDGHHVHVKVTNIPIYVNNKITGVFGIAQDITEERELAERLRESEQRWQHLVEDNPQPVQVTVDGDIVFINEAGARLFGAENANELIGMSVFNFSHPEEEEKIRNRKERLEKGLSVEPLHENKIIRLDGEIRYVEVNSIPIEYQGEQAIQTVLHDVTERKLAEEKIKKSENLKSAILQTALDAIVTIDHDGKIIEFNKAAEQMFGYTKEDVLGQEMAEVIIPPEYREDHYKGLSRYLKTRESKIMGERIHMEAKRADGSVFPVELTIDKITGIEPPRFTGFIRDITDRLKKENQILASLEEKKIMLQEIHHRVKNNLAVISGLLEMQAMKSENKALQEVLKESQLRISSMAMIHEMLYQTETLSDIGFDEYIEELVDTIRSTVDGNSKRITVDMNLQPVSLNVNQAIPCALILNEIVVNCFEHAFVDREDGKIEIEMYRDENDITVGIQDNGVGIPEGFKMEEQQSLGMKLVETLTNQLEGDMSYGPLPDGSGTNFRIVFSRDKKSR